MTRQQHSPEEKSKLVLEAIRGGRTINEITADNNIHPNMLSKWKREAETPLYTLFQDNSSKERKAQKAREAEINDLYTQIGKLTTQNEWLKKNLVSELSVPQRRLLVDMNGSTLPVSVQATLLELNRSGLYYQPAPHSTEDLYIKQLIDKIYTRYPMYGYRRICWYLNKKEHYLINHKAVLRHMQEMGIQAIYPRQNTSLPVKSILTCSKGLKSTILIRFGPSTLPIYQSKPIGFIWWQLSIGIHGLCYIGS